MASKTKSTIRPSNEIQQEINNLPQVLKTVWSRGRALEERIEFHRQEMLGSLRSDSLDQLTPNHQGGWVVRLCDSPRLQAAANTLAAFELTKDRPEYAEACGILDPLHAELAESLQHEHAVEVARGEAEQRLADARIAARERMEREVDQDPTVVAAAAEVAKH